LDYSEGQRVDGRREAGVDRIGPFSMIAQIAGGDFTTVHLAQRQGTLGYQRLMAIKRLKPALAKQPEWTQLLLDEARLSAGVRHPNIVDVIDVANDSNVGVYLVMSYVEGADLEVLITRAGKERHPRYLVPPIVDALTGLHAVHTALDELGESLHMVHQAPRARHILIGIDGTSRITDFSQVSARGLIPSTLRGKRLAAGYMAPEQVLVSEPVSARTDIFIVGITLWETLTGERLFDADNPSLARRAILERHIPRPSEVGLRPPPCFDAICMRALQRNPEQRYQSASEMARELREAAQSESLYASASELGAWVRALASRALVERRRAIGAEDPSQEISLDAPELQEPTPVVRVDVRPAPDTLRPPAPTQEPLFTTAFLSGRAAPASSRSARSSQPPPAPGAPSASESPADGDDWAAAARRANQAVASSQRPSAPASPSSMPASALKTTQLGHHGLEDMLRAEGPAAHAAVAHAIAFDSAPVDSAPVADAPSRVSRSFTVPVTDSSRPAVDASTSAPRGLPTPKATLLGVSARVRVPGTPPAGVDAPRRNVPPPPRPSASEGFQAPPLIELEPTPASATPAAAAPRRARKVSANATLPEGSMLGAYGQPQQLWPAARDPRASRAARPEHAAVEPQALSAAPASSSFGPPPFTGFDDAAPHAPPPASRAAAERGASERFVATPGPTQDLPLSDTSSYADGHEYDPRPRASRVEARLTADGVLPADIFARVQAARREAGDSFRPPPLAAEHADWETGSAPGSRLKPVLMVAVVLVACAFGYRQWSEPAVPVLVPQVAAPAASTRPLPNVTALPSRTPAAAPSASAPAKPPSDARPAAGASAPGGETVPFVPPIANPSALGTPASSGAAPSGAPPAAERVPSAASDVPPPVPPRVDLDDTSTQRAEREDAAVDDKTTPRRVAPAKRSARRSDEGTTERVNAARPAKSGASWQTSRRAADPSLPDNPY
jgi:eukaryotic-like serine/threonine-protein kinase